MPIDPSLSLQVQQPESSISQWGKAMTLKHLMNQAELDPLRRQNAKQGVEMKALAIKQAKQHETDQATVKSIYGQYADDLAGPPEVATRAHVKLVNELSKRVSPELAAPLIKGIAEQNKAALAALKEQETRMSDHGIGIYSNLYDEMQKMTGAGIPSDVIKAKIQPKLDLANKFLEDHLHIGHASLEPTLEAMALRVQGDHQLTTLKDKEANYASLAQTRQAELGLSARRTAAAERRAQRTGSETEKPPTGYQWTDDNHTALKAIPGGRPDTKQKDQGAREGVFTQRMITSANEANKDLENVVQLPLSASTGWFGGRHQGGSLLAAGKEALTNTMTSQEVQSYNVLSSGFQRSLAAIEASGLAPGGALTHQMDAIQFKEGDTNFTKMQKLAQTRQIVEAGMEIVLSNPRVPKEQKAEVQKIIDNIKKSVPFTQSHLIELQRRQAINAKTTLNEIIQKNNAALPKSVHELSDDELKAEAKALGITQ